MSSSDCRADRGSTPVKAKGILKSRDYRGCIQMNIRDMLLRLKRRERQGYRGCVPAKSRDLLEARLQGMHTSQYFNTSTTYLIQSNASYKFNFLHAPVRAKLRLTPNQALHDTAKL